MEEEGKREEVKKTAPNPKDSTKRITFGMGSDLEKMQTAQRDKIQKLFKNKICEEEE